MSIYFWMRVRLSCQEQCEYLLTTYQPLPDCWPCSAILSGLASFSKEPKQPRMAKSAGRCPEDTFQELKPSSLSGVWLQSVEYIFTFTNYSFAKVQMLKNSALMSRSVSRSTLQLCTVYIMGVIMNRFYKWNQKWLGYWWISAAWCHCFWHICCQKIVLNFWR